MREWGRRPAADAWGRARCARPHSLWKQSRADGLCLICCFVPLCRDMPPLLCYLERAWSKPAENGRRRGGVFCELATVGAKVGLGC